MTTVVNNPSPTTNSGGYGFIIGAILIISLTIFVFYFGIPAIKNMSKQQINVAAPQVNIPDKIEVNVQQQ